MEEKCRACLSRDSLFNWNDILAESVSYADLFFNITSLNKKDFEEMQSLCNDCGLQIRGIYQFIKKATEAERTLKEDTFVKHKRLDAESVIEKLSIEILPLTKDEIQKQRETYKLKKECDSDCSLDDVASLENCTYLNEPKSPSPKSVEIKFEMVEVNAQKNDSESQFKHYDDTSREELGKTCQKKHRTAPFSCKYCGKSFKSASTKKRHMATHAVERLLCDVCPRTFRDIWSLVKHKKTHDANRTRDFPCQHCDLKFLTSNALKGHQEIHDDKRQKRFSCDQCDKAFFQKGALNVHRRIHTGNLVRCEICEKRYPRLVDLKIHMRSHTGEQPFKCSTCGKAFKYVSSLYNHVRKEHFGYIYKCSFCSKQYEDIQALIEHKKIHKTCTYRCALCDKEMAKKYRLKCHIKAVHSIENPIELEQLIVSCKAEGKYRTMRNFTNIEYKTHIAQPKLHSSKTTFKSGHKETELESIYDNHS